MEYVIYCIFKGNLNYILIIVLLRIFFSVLSSSSKNKRSILYDKTFLVDIVDNIVSSKVEKLINSYGGVSLQTCILFYERFDLSAKFTEGASNFTFYFVDHE